MCKALGIFSATEHRHTHKTLGKFSKVPPQPEVYETFGEGLPFGGWDRDRGFFSFDKETLPSALPNVKQKAFKQHIYNREEGVLRISQVPGILSPDLVDHENYILLNKLSKKMHHEELERKASGGHYF